MMKECQITIDNEKLMKIKEYADNYLDLEKMVIEGKLIKKGCWYTPMSKEVWEIIAPFGSSIREHKNGESSIKITKLSKRFKDQAGTLRAS